MVFCAGSGEVDFEEFYDWWTSDKESSVLKKAQEARQAAISQNNLSLNVLVRARKDVEREIDERKLLPAPPSSSASAAASS